MMGYEGSHRLGTVKNKNSTEAEDRRKCGSFEDLRSQEKRKRAKQHRRKVEGSFIREATAREIMGQIG